MSGLHDAEGTVVISMKPNKQETDGPFRSCELVIGQAVPAELLVRLDTWSHMEGCGASVAGIDAVPHDPS